MTASAQAVRDREDPRLEAAQRRVRESVGKADTLEALREIVTNLMGCEEMGLFLVGEGKTGLCWSFGIDPQKHATLEALGEKGLERVFEGECQVVRVTDHRHSGHSKPPLRVFVPIRFSGRTVAVLAMLRLLPQKVDFDEADIRLAQVVSDEIGKALFDPSTSKL